MNRSALNASVAALVLAFAVAPVAAAEKKAATGEKPIAVVNGKSIPANRADALIAAQIARGQPDSDSLRKAVQEELVRREILVQEAQKTGIDKKPDVQAQMDLARQGVLIGAYLSNFLRSHPVTDEAIKKEYEVIRATLGDKEYKARHILVENEDDAKAIVAKLKGGEKFEELAKQSKDPGSKERGGDLGWASGGSFVKPFQAALVKLEKGKYTEAPVKTDFGWHVILLDDSRELKAPALEEVKAEISQRLQQKIVEQQIAELRSKAKVQ